MSRDHGLSACNTGHHIAHTLPDQKLEFWLIPLYIDRKVHWLSLHVPCLAVMIATMSFIVCFYFVEMHFYKNTKWFHYSDSFVRKIALESNWLQVKEKYTVNIYSSKQLKIGKLPFTALTMVYKPKKVWVFISWVQLTNKLTD